MTDPSITPAVIIPDAPSSTPLPTPGPNDPPPATPPTMGDVLNQLDAANAKNVVPEATTHELEVKLNERDAEILALKTTSADTFKLLEIQKGLTATAESNRATGVEVTCPTCGTRVQS